MWTIRDWVDYRTRGIIRLMMTWAKSSSHSIRAAEGPYSVSRSTVLDTATGELMEAYVAWHEATPISRHLGEFGPAKARAACERHAKNLKGLAGAVNTGPAITHHA